MSHYCCKRCGQRYDVCCCSMRDVVADITGIIPKESVLTESEEEQAIRFEKFYQEVKDLALKYEVRFK